MSIGVVLINQQRAMAGNITPGDAPGFPIRISVPGSYQLSGNLKVTGTGPVSTPAFEITTDDVTLDLNGFVISGLSPEWAGIATDKKNITVMNGTVKYMSGLRLGPNCRIENMRLSGVRDGIQTGSYSLVRNNTIEAIDIGIVTGECCIVAGNSIQAEELGIQVGRGSLVTGNTLHGFGVDGNGIMASGSVITGNAVTGVANTIRIQNGIRADKGSTVINNKVSNASIGLNLSNDTGYADNVLTENNTHVSGGIKMGINICGTTPCP